MKEIWKNIDGYNGKYKISNFGRVLSIKKKGFSIHSSGRKYFYKGKDIFLKASNKTYKCFALTKNGKTKYFQLHRLLAKAFIPNPENKPCINHKDGNKYNNYLYNLEWCTYSENIIHAYKNGLMKEFLNSGELNGRSKLNNEEALTIRETYKNMDGKKTYKRLDLGEVFNCSQITISRIVNKTHWNIEAYE